MADLAPNERDQVLRSIFGGTNYVGVTRSQPTAGEPAQDEESDPGYKRRLITLSDPQGDDVRFVTNPEPVLFPEYQHDAERPVTHAFLSDSPEGGVVKWADALATPEQLRAGGILFFAAGKFRIGVP